MSNKTDAKQYYNYNKPTKKFDKDAIVDSEKDVIVETEITVEPEKDVIVETEITVEPEKDVIVETEITVEPEIINPEEKAKTLFMIVTGAAKVNMRETPSLDGKILGVMLEGDKLTIGGPESNGWIPIVIEATSQCGYIMSKFLKEV